MKYGIWNIGQFDPAQQKDLCAAGYSPLTASVLCSRGYGDAASAQNYLSTQAPLCDPLTMQDMEKAAGRVRQALEGKQTIAVFGDYDVDGITATCLLTDYLRSRGGRVIPYIPARIEEGYGLNRSAILALKEQGAGLIITVDCGITAEEEALLCREHGIDLVITDHHECKERLPQALAVVDPHRKDCGYPHAHLAGCGVAFKLAAAVEGDQGAILDRYCDLVALGTVADVMPLEGENRTMVAMGLKKLSTAPRPGIRALMEECGCANSPVTASLIGYTLAPRINAAGRMENVDAAVELFLTRDAHTARELAAKLCKMNRHRQSVETEIYHDAVKRLSAEEDHKDVIVLSGESWHQGVVGIVSSRLAEEFRCPTFLICMDGDKGKASSRSYGGFRLFSALESLSYLLESFGGHELAAGFTIRRENIHLFRQEMEKKIRAFRATGEYKSALEIDCEVSPEMLTIKNVDALEQLEPCGAGCPRPVFFLRQVRVDSLSSVGAGKHLRLRLSKNGKSFGAICFSTTAADLSVGEGDLVELAFQPQINEFRGSRSVQLNLIDLRQEESLRLRRDAQEAQYAAYVRGEEEIPITPPNREHFVSLWKYLSHHSQEGVLRDSWANLAGKSARKAGHPEDLTRTRICLDVLEELGLLSVRQKKNALEITLGQDSKKVDLDSSRILRDLHRRLSGEFAHE